MTCAIYDVEVTAAVIGSGGIVDSIIVSGKVQDCRAGTLHVGVAGSPTDTGGPINVNLSTFGFDPANTATEIEWETDPIKLNVPCGDLVLVNVQCPHEVACQISVYVQVNCCPLDPAAALAAVLRITTPSGATDLTPQNISELAELSPQDCNPDGDYVLEIRNYVLGAEITWTEEDLSTGTTSEVLSGIDETTYTYSLQSSSGSSHKTIHVLIEYVDCDISKPLSVTFKPCADDCASRGMITNPDGTCGTPPTNGPPKDPPVRDQPSNGCLVGRWSIVILLMLAILLAELAYCLNLPYLYYVVAGLGIAAAILIVLYKIFCRPKPCKWVLLITWQSLLGAGLLTLFFTECCNYLLWFALAQIAAGVGLLIWWKQACKASMCTIVSELTPLMATVIVPIITAIGNVAQLTAIPIIGPLIQQFSCWNPIVLWILGLLVVVWGIWAGICSREN